MTVSKDTRSFCLDMINSQRIDKIMDEIEELKAFELPFVNISQLVNFIFYETLPTIEKKIEEIKKKRLRK